MGIRTKLSILFVISFVLSSAAPQAFAASLIGLGDLPGGLSGSFASDLSSDGTVVVGSGNAASGLQTIRWTEAGGLVGLDCLPTHVSCSALGVSSDGAVVVGTSVNQAFRWTQGGGTIGLGFLPGGTGSFAIAASSDGAVVVGGSSTAVSPVEAFRWTQGGGMVGLGDLPGGLFESGAEDVSADGTVIVGQGTTAIGIEAFRWTQGGGMVPLGVLPIPGVDSSSAHAVTPDGSVVVGVSQQAFRWTQGGGMVALGLLPGSVVSNAQAVSSDGSVIVGFNTITDGAFIWDSVNGMQRLSDVLTNLGVDLTGITLSTATGISADGTIITGTAIFNSEQEAFLANLSTGAVAVGGDFLPIDSTMVLLAGTHSTVSWMIPVLVSAIGIGIVIARKF